MLTAFDWPPLRPHQRILTHLLLVPILLLSSWAAHAQCDAPVARLISMQGVVEVSAAGKTEWHPARVGQDLCAGELVTVRKQSRAAVLFEGDVLTRLDQFSTLEIAARPKDGDAALGLREGIVHVISRLKKRVEVIAPVVNALVEGTEFTVMARGDNGRVVVAEGRVRVSNDAGVTRLTAGQAADVSPGQTPRAIPVQPLDSVRWAIHYPLVVWPASDNLKAARALGVRARYTDALARLEGQDGGEAQAYRANLLLALGRFDDAQRVVDGDLGAAQANALRATIAVAQSRLTEARQLIDTALSTQPESATVHMAASYVYQAEGRLDAALQAAIEATRRRPGNPLAWARRAEMELTLARLEDGQRSAQHALDIDAGTVRAKAMIGFALVLSGDLSEAGIRLTDAIAADPADPLAHYALGLNEIRQGRVAEGRRELEVAVLLDPSNVEYRAILGRAYMAEHQDKHAATQLELAARIDPASPSPRFFEAQRRLLNGDMLGAIDVGNQALELNDNRLTLRSPGLLATDRAARATTLGSAYRLAGLDGGFKEVAADAVEADPSSGSVHRLMAQAYTDDQRLEIARVSEQFQSFIYGDIGEPMVMPQDLVTAIPVLNGARVMSLNETAAMFGNTPNAFSMSGLVGSQETWGASAMASAGGERYQASVGHFDYRSDGFAEDGKIDLSATRGQLRWQATQDLMLFGDVLHKDLATDDVTQSLYTIYSATAASERSDLTRAGLRFKMSPTSSLVLVGSNESGSKGDSNATPETVIGLFHFQTDADSRTRFSRHGLGLRFDAEGEHTRYQLGASSYRLKETARTNEIETISSPFFSIVNPSSYRVREDAKVNRIFGQLRWAFVERAALYLRGVFVRYDDQAFKYDGSTVNDVSRRDTERLMPSVGLAWRDGTGTTLRGAFIQDVSTPSPGNQSLMPTRFAGFDASFDDVPGTRFRRLALGVERRLGHGASVGGEWSRRKMGVSYELCAATDCMTRWDEHRHSVHLTWPLTRYAGAEIGWRYYAIRLLRQDIPAVAGGYQPLSMRTEELPLRLFVQWPSQWRSSVEVVRVRQDVTNLASAGRARNNASFWVTNVQLQYGSPGSRWGVGLEVRNLFDQDALIQDTDLLTAEPRTPLWYPERSVFLTARFGF
ncbi:TonB-dependent receptor [Nitrogeniibacter mangrovi]|uniref:TonB-dependent receptor n=1 Tax=Nitrogeniibacter mangrovi TaxID=2016596 RepID=A0A6C1B1K7_9RHOO|nr:FecR domain-containing protein [Nitrogeniibacter mangrovi]QID17502.1 TonB-dependent receptor [Nitrogeniibacter mangrovi]